MDKTYSDGVTLTAIIEAETMPSYTFGPEASKLRYKEPYVSEAMDLKDSGIIPTGIYNGFTPVAAGAGTNILYLNVDSGRGDSVAVVETRTGRYNLTVRCTSQISLSGFDTVSFPSLVVLRTEYSITTSPLSGVTTSKILVVDPTLDDSDSTNLNTGDVKICRVTGNGGGTVTFTTVAGTDREDNGGSLITQVEATPVYSQAILASDYTTTNTYTLVPGLQLTVNTISGRPMILTYQGYRQKLIAGDRFLSLDIKIDGTLLSVLRGYPTESLMSSGRDAGGSNDVYDMAFSVLYVPPTTASRTFQLVAKSSFNGDYKMYKSAQFWAYYV